jgi:signal peptidase
VAKVKQSTRALLIAGVLLAAISGVLINSGYRVYAVRTGSMAPGLKPGDAVIDAPVGEPAVGDVITFRAGGSTVITHRVHDVSSAGIQTMGDANRTPDLTRVHPDGVVGKVIRSIPRGGYALYFLSQPSGVGAVMTAMLTLLMLWSLFFSAPDDRSAEPC